jgi:hypothetical protein
LRVVLAGDLGEDVVIGLEAGPARVEAGAAQPLDHRAVAALLVVDEDFRAHAVVERLDHGARALGQIKPRFAPLLAGVQPAQLLDERVRQAGDDAHALIISALICCLAHEPFSGIQRA